MKKLFLLIPVLLFAVMASAQGTDFSVPGYSCTADAATITPNVYGLSLFTESEPHYISCNDVAYNAVLATWTINATRACYVSVSLDLGPIVSSNKHIFEVKILDSELNPIGTVAEGAADEAASTDGFKNDYNVEKPLDGKILIPTAGEYTVQLLNIRGFGKGSVKNVILTYAGEAPVTDFAAPYSCAADDAVLNNISGLSLFTESNPHYIICNECAYDATLATWTIYATRACYISATLDFGPAVGSNKHIFEVKIKDANGNVKGTVAEGEADPNGSTEQNKEAEQLKAINGQIHIPAAGIYTLELRNIRGYGKGSVKNVILTYAGGATISVPANTLEANDAIIENGTRTDGVISFADPTTGSVKWNVDVTEGAAYDINITIKNQYGHNITATFYEEDGTTYVNEVGEGKNVYSNNSEGHSINLGSIYLKSGKYVMKVTNATSGSDAKFVSASFAKVGGAVQNMPGSTDLSEAWFSPNGTRAGGKITYSDVSNGCWAKWQVNVANSLWYNVIVDICGQYGHNYTVEFLKEGETTPVTVTKGATNYTNDATLYHNNLGLVYLESGNYEIKVSNSVGDAALIGVTLSYGGGNVMDMPGTTDVADAWFSPNGTRADGKIDFPNSEINTSYVKWNVSFANTGNYNVKVNVNNGNGHNYSVALYENANDQNPRIVTEGSQKSSTGTPNSIDLGAMVVPAGNYILEVTNAVQHSDAELISVQFVSAGGGIVNIPADPIPFSDAILSTNAYIDEGNLYFTNEEGYTTIANEYAKWNIHANGGLYKFTANFHGTKNYSNLTISILDGENELYTSTTQYACAENADKTLTTPEWLLTEGDYILKVFNPTNHSRNYLVSLAATAKENVLVLDEQMENMDILVANNGQSKRPLIQRTFRTGVYNSLCLPFNVSGNDELTTIFGAGYELLEMTSATLDDAGILTLDFATPSNNVQYGRPYLIKPTKDVVNPLFNSHTIQKSTSHLTVSGDAANYVGVLNKQDLGTHPENLYLGTDGKLYFSNSNVTIKGFRAYFTVNVPEPQQVVKRARLVTPHNMPTEIELVSEELKANSQKLIENGQLLIIRDGVHYDVMGVRVK